MKLKVCTCGNPITTKSATRVIRAKDESLDYLCFNCPKCNSTMTLFSKDTVVKIAAHEAQRKAA